jgi:hypothetical protein
MPGQMSSPRTVSVTLFLIAEPDPLPHGGAFEDVVRVYPHVEVAIGGLREGGWRLESIYREGEALDLATNSTALGTCVRFEKDFVNATPIAAAEDARRCGVTDELGPVFGWTEDCGDTDDGLWDGFYGEL